MTPPLLRGLIMVVVGVALVVVPNGPLVARGPLAAIGRRRWLRRTVAGLGGLVLIIGLAGTWWAVAMATGDRSPRELTVAPGIHYRRIPIDEPRPQVAHVATIDLDAPCLRLDTTRPADDGEVLAETSVEFAERTGATLAVNVAFFFPIDEYPHWDAYPTSGDPITAIGQVVVDGETFGSPTGGWGIGVGLDGGRPWAGPTPADPDFAVPGRHVLIADGRVVAPVDAPYPRTVAGVDHDANQLVLVVADGKQPGYAESMTYREVADLLIGLGVDDAVELDGGGSATMVARVDADDVELLSRPSHQRIPGRQRPVATHLGVVTVPGCG